MYKFFIAFKYLKSHKIIYFSIAAVAIGIMVLIIVTSVMSGFSRDIRDRIRGMQSHLVIRGVDSRVFVIDYETLLEDLKKIDGIKGCAPRIEWPALVGRKSIVTIVGIDPSYEKSASDLEKYFTKGGKTNFDFERDDKSIKLRPGIVIGSEYSAHDIGLMAARDANIPMQFNQDFDVVGHFKSGMSEYDFHNFFMDLKDAQRFLKLTCTCKPCSCTPCKCQKPAVTNVIVTLHDYERDAERVRSQILDLLHRRTPCSNPNFHQSRARCGIYEIRSWEEVKSTLLAAVSIEKNIQIVILFCIIIVAGFNIIAIYTLMVKAKSRDIGIIKALGGSSGGIAIIFLLGGLFCGMIGSIFGVIAGLVASFNLNEVAGFIESSSKELVSFIHKNEGSIVVKYYPLVALAGFVILAFLSYLSFKRGRSVSLRFLIVIFLILYTIISASLAPVFSNPPPLWWQGVQLFPKDVYYLDRIPAMIHYPTIVFIVVATMIVGVLFSIYPALKAASFDPVECIRRE